MKLQEFENKDPEKMTLEELEQSCLDIADELSNILEAAHARIDRERNATNTRE